MRFVITNSEFDDKKPCREARRQEYIRVDERTVDDPKKVPAHSGQSAWWFSEGKNHRVEKGWIKRDFKEKAWFVEFATMEQFEQFIQRHSEMEIRPFHSNRKLMEIKIQED